MIWVLFCVFILFYCLYGFFVGWLIGRDIKFCGLNYQFSPHAARN